MPKRFLSIVLMGLCLILGCANVSRHPGRSIARVVEPEFSPSPIKGMKLALTMDDLPDDDDKVVVADRLALAQNILRTFKSYNVPEVYGFTNAYSLKKYPGLEGVLKAWVAAGYPLGNHTFDHPDLDVVSTVEYETSILKNEPFLQRYSKPVSNWKYFRYPFLDEGEDPAKKLAIQKFLFRHGYTIAEVSMDFQDWALTSAYVRCSELKDAKSLDFIKAQYVKGAQEALEHAATLSQAMFHRQVPQILLLHIGAIEGVMLSDLLKSFKDQGVEFVKLQDALNDPVYTERPATPYPGDGSYFEQILSARGQTGAQLGVPDIVMAGENETIKTICGGPSED